MAKRIKVGSRYRKGFKLKVDGEWKWFAPGEILPKQFNEEIPGRFFRDKRATWVDIEEGSVKKATPSPTSKVAGVDKAPAPSEVSSAATKVASDSAEDVTEELPVTKKKKTRTRKKLFSD
jgi:hypothetical protein